MRLSRHCFVLAVAAALPLAPAPAQNRVGSVVPAMIQSAASPLTDPIDPANRPMAVELARLIASEKQLDGMVEKTSDGIRFGLRVSADGEQLDQDYPGIIEHMTASMEAQIARNAHDRRPGLIEATAEVYARRMTSDDLRTALDFYRSPVGIWTADTFMDSINIFALVADRGDKAGEVMPDPAKFTSPFSLLAGLTPERRTAIEAFSRTSAFSQLKAVQTETYRLSYAFGKEIGGAPNVLKAAIAARDEFIAAADAHAIKVSKK